MRYPLQYEPSPDPYTIRCASGFMGASWVLIRNCDRKVMTQGGVWDCLYWRRKLLAKDRGPTS